MIYLLPFSGEYSRDSQRAPLYFFFFRPPLKSVMIFIPLLGGNYSPCAFSFFLQSKTPVIAASVMSLPFEGATFLAVLLSVGSDREQPPKINPSAKPFSSFPPCMLVVSNVLGFITALWVVFFEKPDISPPATRFPLLLLLPPLPFQLRLPLSKYQGS